MDQYKVEIFDLRFPDNILYNYSANSLEEAHAIGRAEIQSVYIEALMTQGVIIGRYDYKIKEQE